MNKRDLFLQQMGITQWQLQRPDNLKGAVQIHLDENIKLIIITEQTINKHSRLFNDILLALNLSETQCYILSVDQLQHINPIDSAAYWLLSQNTEKIDRTLTILKGISTIWQSPEISEFTHNAQSKRQLWQKMQGYLSQGIAE